MASIEHQLLRLHVHLGDDEAQLDALHLAFQEADRDGRGSLKNAAELEAVLREHLSPKNMKKIDAEALVARFSTPTSRFDYATFCKALQQPPSLQAESSQSGRHSPAKRRSRSPTKVQHREQARMRMDKRLESQRLLVESVRQKLIRGIQGDESDGFQAIQNALQRLDVAGEGYLDASVFTKKFIQRLKVPLTRPERDFLLEQLRAQSSGNESDLLDYEQLGRICNLSSDDSLSEGETEQEQPKAPSPSKASQLGANFLVAEKRLNDFLRAPLVDRKVADKSSTTFSQAQDTPRCLITGAEKFLDSAEAIDQDNTGLLHEDEFPRVLSKCGVNIDPDLLSGMLSRFPRSSGKFISYAAFLQRYGQNPQYSRGRRELKLLVIQLLARLTVPAAEWIRFLHQRFEKYDRKLHGTIKSSLPTEGKLFFLRVVQGRSVVLKLTTDEAAQLTSLFLRSSSNSSSSHLHYHEFLMFIAECHRMKSPPAIDTTSVPSKLSTTENLLPTSPKAIQLCHPETPTEPTLDTSEMAVGDYLMLHALPRERRNFEHLMEMLQNFQNTVDDDDENEAIQRIANGVMLSLGKKLRVKVQFSICM
ncbi:hypothetical protein PHYPSEUDO_012903 [Phytophthora pseudosyringae]|uniref:Uncharacterized protein n=1 Tax=Phytophthora pseudosyringae TaxID=221518 RepID=A0A8T1W4E1_9STRA|nr:hypothetical protein PHYPSEUDO_012903 [Phytophthora pseudosyringae]